MYHSTRGGPKVLRASAFSVLRSLLWSQIHSPTQHMVPAPPTSPGEVKKKKLEKQDVHKTSAPMSWALLNDGIPTCQSMSATLLRWGLGLSPKTDGVPLVQVDYEP